jgi:peptidyl-prolyl cis-trans isomerase D
MLKLMRDSFSQLKWILVAIVAIFILFIFVDWGAGGPRSGNSPDTKGYAARVNGETISLREYDRAVYYLQKSYEQQMRQPLTDEMMVSMGLKKRALDSLIDQHLLMQEARRMHLAATPEEVRKRILEIPTLNPDGKFVGPELYTRYVTGALGFGSTAEFEDEIADEITIMKMESALTNGLVVSPKAALEEYKRVTENAKIRYVLYPASREAATTTVSPAEVQQYFQAHQADYQHSEQRAIKYLIADTARLRLQFNPTDSDLQKRYEATKEDFKHPEQAHILHILIKVAQGVPPALDAAAKAKADNIVKQLRAGADFAKLARENSGDPSSAMQGGDMNWVDKGATVEPFDTAAFSIPLNTISDPIRSQEFGYHIIKVLERRPEGYRSFEEVKPQLSAQMSDELAKNAARDEVARIATRLKQSKPKNAAEFTALANDKVSSNDTQWFGKADSIPGLGSNAPLATWAFNAKVGDVGDITATARGPMIPYLYQIRPAGVPPLDEIRAKVENDARMAKAREAAKATLAHALPAANIDEVAKKVGLTAADTTVTRQGYVSGFTGNTSELVSAAMSSTIGAVSGPITVGDGAVVFQVTEQKKVDPKAADDNKTQYSEMLRQQEARNLRTVLLERLRKQSTVDVNDTLMQNRPAQQAGL